MKPAKIIGGVVIVAALAVGAYFIFHKSNDTSDTKSDSSTSTNAPAANAPSVNNSVLSTKTSASSGQYLTDPSGKPLYTYGSDTSGVSNCTGACLSNWPAYTAASSTALPAGISTIKRSDNGEAQYTYNGMPLYYFASDSGSTPTGDGVGGFSLAKPAAASSSVAPQSSAGSSDSAAAASSAPASSGDDW